MNEIERKALALVNEVRRERNQDVWKDVGDRKGYGMVLEALCRAIEQHEAFRQEVSDAVERWNIEYLLGDALRADMARFIIAKPDPLVEALKDLSLSFVEGSYPIIADEFRAALAARGLKIVEVGHD